MEIEDFFLRKWENDSFPSFLSSPHSFNLYTAQKFVTDVIAIPYGEFLDFIRLDSLSPCVLSSDIPQFSNIDSATTKICEVLSENPGELYKFEQIGALLQPDKKRNIVADKKYGENHVKVSTELSLCAISNGLYYITPIGLIYNKLSEYQQDQLLSRLVLRNSLVYNVLHKALMGFSVNLVDEISFLSETTVKRRKNNCLFFCGMITRNRDINVNEIISLIK